MIYISSNNGRHPVNKTFTPLHYTSVLYLLALMWVVFSKYQDVTNNKGTFSQYCSRACRMLYVLSDD